MASSDFQIDTLVWAKMKSYPPWPAKIVEPKVDAKPPKSKKAHFVYFFGSKNYAWIADENIRPHSEEILLSLSKKKSAAYQNAITEFLNNAGAASDKVKKKATELPLSKESNEESLNISVEGDVNQVEKSPRTKVVKVIDREEKPKEKKVMVKAKKKVVKRRIHDKDSAEGCSAPKYRKAESPGQPLVGSVPPDDDSSDFASMPISGSSSQAVIDSFVSVSAQDLGKSNIALQRKHVSASGKEFGFIGMGHIGKSVVINLLNSGHNVTVFNRSAYKCETFLPLGAKVAHSAAEMIVSCDITFCSVSDPAASKTLVFGKKGILEGLEIAQKLGKGDRGYVEMTTIDPETSEQIAEAILRQKGRYLEAPIFGNSQDALEGTLFILASGDRRVFKDCETCFHAIGKHAYYIDCKVGFGCKFSLLLNSYSGSMYAVLAEVITLCQRCNLDVKYLLQILSKGPSQCFGLLMKALCMNRLHFRTVTPLKHMQNHLHQSLMMGDTHRVAMRIHSAANELYKQARLLRYTNLDVSAIYNAARY